MADHGDLNPTDEPEGAITDEGSNNADGGSNTKVPRWVIKAITLFWVGWAVTYVGTGMLRNLRGFLIIVLISLFLGFAIEPAVNKLERWGVRRGLGVGPGHGLGGLRALLLGRQGRDDELVRDDGDVRVRDFSRRPHG